METGLIGQDKQRELRDGDHVMAVLGVEGDVKTIWDPENADEVENARRTFDDLRAKGYQAFQVEGKKGEKGQRMDKFDPKAGRMIMCLPMVGG